MPLKVIAPVREPVPSKSPAIERPPVKVAEPLFVRFLETVTLSANEAFPLFVKSPENVTAPVDEREPLFSISIPIVVEGGMV